MDQKTDKKMKENSKKNNKIIASICIKKCDFIIKTKREKAVEMSLLPFLGFGSSIWKRCLIVPFTTGTYKEIRYLFFLLLPLDFYHEGIERIHHEVHTIYVIHFLHQTIFHP